MLKSRRVMNGMALIAGFFLMVSFQNCSPHTNFTSTPSESLSDDGAGRGPADVPVGENFVKKSSRFVVSGQPNGKMDILIVIDNSVSMEEEQRKLATAFAGFIDGLKALDWRVGITTTDNLNLGKAGTFGRLLPLKLKTDSGAGLIYMNKATPDANAVFIDAIQTGTNGSPSELGLTSIKNFVSLSLDRTKNEFLFIRPDAAFSTIVVTDADEAVSSVKDFLTSAVTRRYPAGKKYVHHSSVALPGDSACLRQSEYYGSSYAELSDLTGGVKASLCSPTYASQFAMIADTLIKAVGSQTLDCAPIDADKDGRPDVTITDPNGFVIRDFTMKETHVTFKNPLSILGHYSVNYICAK